MQKFFIAGIQKSLSKVNRINLTSSEITTSLNLFTILSYMHHIIVKQSIYKLWVNTMPLPVLNGKPLDKG